MRYAQSSEGCAARNVDVPEDRRIEFRIGINLGDVIVEGDDLFGDGVNVAARLEGVARPGGIAVSQSVRDNVGNQLDLSFEDTGEQQLKNIELPVRVYDVVLDTGGIAAMKRRGPAGGGADKPSIAVLPFTNMSGDPEQEYFSDGITEDIITDLARSAACSSSGATPASPTRACPPSCERIAAELGVKFLLEGSVRKAGQPGADHRAADRRVDRRPSLGRPLRPRPDRHFRDPGRNHQGDRRQLKVRLLPEEMKAYRPGADRQCRGLYALPQGPAVFPQLRPRSFLGLARQMFVKAIELDPDIRPRLCRHRQLRSPGWSAWYDEPIPDATKSSRLPTRRWRSIPSWPKRMPRGRKRSASAGTSEEAEAAFEQALELDPNSFEANLLYARLLHADSGDFETAVELFIRALEIQPDDYQAPLLLQIDPACAGPQRGIREIWRASA